MKAPNFKGRLGRGDMDAISDRLKEMLSVTDAAFSARALRILAGPSRRVGLLMRLASVTYYAVILLALGWLVGMATDNALPVKIVSRSLLTPTVPAGDDIEIRSRRVRLRQCELTRRFVIVDVTGRRYDFEPERWDAFGPVSANPEEDITRVPVPREARPGRARYTAILAWDCNPLQRALGWSITLVQPAIEFEILARPP